LDDFQTLDLAVLAFGIGDVQRLIGLHDAAAPDAEDQSALGDVVQGRGFLGDAKRDLEQPHRSRHHQELLDPDAGQRLLAENGKWVRDRLARNGVPCEAIEKYLLVIGNAPAMEAALAWYRAR